MRRILASSVSAIIAVARAASYVRAADMAAPIYRAASRLAKLLAVVGVVVVGLPFAAATAQFQWGPEIVFVHHDGIGDYTWEFDDDWCDPDNEANWYDDDCFYKRRLRRDPATGLYHSEVLAFQDFHPYLGVNGSVGFGQSNIFFPDGATGNFGTSGGMGGVTFGANWLISFPSQGQVSRGSSEPWKNHSMAAAMEHSPNWALLLGIEGDIDFGGMSGSPSINCASCQTSNTTLGTVRGVVGLTSNQLHGFTPYVTAGLAYGNVHTTVGGLSNTDWKAGYAVGLGTTKALGHDWQLNLQYLHVDLGDASCAPACGNGGTARFSEDLFRVGFNHRFDF